MSGCWLCPLDLCCLGSFQSSCAFQFCNWVCWWPGAIPDGTCWHCARGRACVHYCLWGCPLPSASVPPCGTLTLLLLGLTVYLPVAHFFYACWLFWGQLPEQSALCGGKNFIVNYGFDCADLDDFTQKWFCTVHLCRCFMSNPVILANGSVDKRYTGSWQSVLLEIERKNWQEHAAWFSGQKQFENKMRWFTEKHPSSIACEAVRSLVLWYLFCFFFFFFLNNQRTGFFFSFF